MTGKERFNGKFKIAKPDGILGRNAKFGILDSVNVMTIDRSIDPTRPESSFTSPKFHGLSASSRGLRVAVSR